jgi:hypothetical protein
MTFGNANTATPEQDRDRLQEFKGTLHHWAVMARQYSQETQDPYVFMQFMNVERTLRSTLDAVEQTIAIQGAERADDMLERMSVLHSNLCEKTTVFGSPC